MRVIAHLSDLHFGRIDPATIEPLLERIHSAKPHVVVVSGDLTQRARRAQFRAARAFLERLPQPRVVVPGNHDVPLYDVFNRFLRPLKRFTRYIEQDLEPQYIDEEVAVVGINTARSLVFKGGRINEEQIERVRARLEPLGEQVVKVIATHHPFDLPPGSDEGDLVGRARRAMESFARCGADLLLAGHMHVAQSGSSALRHRIPGFSAVVAHAGTATSTRSRGEPNSFNLIRVDSRSIVIERCEWRADARRFETAATDRYRREGNEWRSDERTAP